MARPTIEEETLDRLKEIVDARAKVPADHLTPDQRLAFALDELADADQRVQRLSNRVETLESKIEELRGEEQQQPGGGLNPSGGSVRGNGNQF
jgi:ubiquinone biosynthesis protein UbiJ